MSIQNERERVLEASRNLASHLCKHGEFQAVVVVLEATELHNSYSKSPLPLPAREDYP